MMARRIVWFSCGAASAVLAYEATRRYDNVTVVYCDVMGDEHPDNQRFFDDVQEWIGQPIQRIKSEKYDSVQDVFEDRRFMSGPMGAPCTVEMKKVPRFAFQEPDDIHLFGFTADEQHRLTRFDENNPELDVEWLLSDLGITKADCYRILVEHDIRLPELYELGYNNNNCLGCVKASSARYWNMVRRDFPDVFQRRAETSRRLGARLTRYNGERIFLDELPADYMPAEPLEDISCGPDCAVQLTLVPPRGK